MNWMMERGFTMLLAMWLVCQSEPHPQTVARGSRGAGKMLPVSQVNGRSLRLLRHTGRAQGSVRGMLDNPDHPILDRRRAVPVMRLARPTPLPVQARVGGSRTRQEQRPTAKSSPREMVKDEGSSARAKLVRFPSGSSSPNILAGFAGKNRVWVISAPHASEGYYRLMMSLLKDDVYCELAERHIQQIVLFHEAGEEGGKVRRITNEGQILEQSLDPTLIPKLMSFLKLEKGKFGMVLLKKTLQVEERYPYPVRLEAMYEIIDQGPIRRIEKIRQKGFVQKCKAAGLEGQVVEEGNNGGGGGSRAKVGSEKKKEDARRGQVQPTRESRLKQVKKLATTTVAPPPTARVTMLPPSPPRTAAWTTPRVVTVATRPTTTTTPFPTTQRTWTTRAHTTSTSHRQPIATEVTTPRSTWESEDFYPPSRKDQHRERQQTTRRPSKTTGYESHTAATPTTPDHYTRAGVSRFRDNRTDRKEYGPRDPNVVPGQHKPGKAKPPKKKILSNEYEDKYDPSRPTASQLEELEGGNIPAKKGKETKKHERPDKPDKKKKAKNEKPDKQTKKDKAEKKNKQDKDRNKKKKGSKAEHDGYLKPTTKLFTQSSKKSVTDLLAFFEGKRRLILITAPKAENNMYVQQRDEYLESFCKMATRKISVITIFGPVNNSTMKIDHFQLGGFKKHFITFFSCPKGGPNLGEREHENQYYEVPIAMKSVFDLIDTFQSRIKDMERQKKEGIVCKEDKKQSLENFLSRFRWRRRLLVISAPNDEDWAYSQQLSALSGQACNFGLRHITILKLLGLGEDIGGVLELFPINGSSVVEREDLPAHLVKDIRNYFQISPEYFSMLLVGKDGNVKSWYPSPMWSMVIVYDLIDSMQLRRQEMAIQQSLGMRCPEDEYAGYGYHSYHQGYQDGYQDDYRHHEGYHHGYPY
uniref:Coiled-coil domain-containing protein 80 n=1 Tax=Monodelphis domestica TaxID=13616 RepID=F7F1Z0_MONDO